MVALKVTVFMAHIPVTVLEAAQENGGGNAPNNSGGGGNKRVAPNIVDMYGAVALNNDAFAFGYSANQSSKSSAAFEAIKSCAQSGCKRKVVASMCKSMCSICLG